MNSNEIYVSLLTPCRDKQGPGISMKISRRDLVFQSDSLGFKNQRGELNTIVHRVQIQFERELAFRFIGSMNLYRRLQGTGTSLVREV